MTAKRPVTPLQFEGLAPAEPPTSKPELTWISPTELLVDEVYQRALGEKGLRLIKRIVEHFDWRKFKPPTAVWTSEGLEVLDGQHSAIAAATHPGIDQIPVVIVEAVEIRDRAEAFVSINRDRLNITQMQMHAAALVAGDAEAQAVERVCTACGVRVLRVPPPNGAYKPRDTVAIVAIGGLIKRIGEPLAIEVMRVLAEAEIKPVTQQALRAAEALLIDQEYADTFDPGELTKAIVALGPGGDKEAAVFAATHCVPKWKGLVAVWYKKTKKRKPTPESSSKIIASFEPQAIENTTSKASEPALRSPPVTSAQKATNIHQLSSGGHVIDRRVSGPISMGEPAPGRSALDQRRAAAGQK